MDIGTDIDLFLADFPDPIRESAETLRAIVNRTVPDAIERLRAGWRLIGYDVAAGRKSRYFGYVAPEPEHVHLGFEYGAWMADPDRLLEGAHLGLRKVRFLTFRPGEGISEAAVAALTREAVRMAAMSPAERASLALDREWQRSSGEPRTLT
ncbi:MAG TPA: DUF1801 domain-containing protein [Candidatus Limnocylindrales bacterium]|jgi:hypothetical protein|nr:DUF1801 domain-containing protein [Candidatus Limnocylindrales bacterium]